MRILIDMTRPVTVQLPEDTAKAIDVRPEQLPHEVREAAVLRWFEEGRLSQGQASSREIGWTQPLRTISNTALNQSSGQFDE